MADITLNPDNEFETQIIKIVKMHREKAKAYGSNKDSMANFYGIEARTFVTPLQACEVLGAKHEVVATNFLETGEVTKYTDDAFLDRAVYKVLALVLYERFKAE